MKNVLLCIFCALTFLSCKRSVEDQIIVIWTNKTEVVSYCEFFNASQDEYKAIVEYKENPAQSILEEKRKADIVIAPWLKGSATRGMFEKINHLLSKKIDSTLFYDGLLELGNIDACQYLLPVSFNLPTIVFSISNKHLLENNFTISFDEIKGFASHFNVKNGQMYTKMCFAPRWEKEVLYFAMQGLGVDFEEDSLSFKWNDESLEKSIAYLKDWTVDVNESTDNEDEFKFKYLYDMPYLLVKNGFCTFYYMPTDALFSLSKEKIENIDFRYLEFNGDVPCKDDILYAGILSDSENKKASEAFLTWFYLPEVQRKILERKMEQKLLSSYFGIAGGFSALKPITEKVFPQYYSLLLSHLPQNQSLKMPRILPNNWEKLKNEILYPYLLEITSSTLNVKDDDLTDKGILKNDEVSLLKERIRTWESKH